MKNLFLSIYEFITKLHILAFNVLIIYIIAFSYHQKAFGQGQFNLRLQTGFPLEEFAEENESIAFGVGGLLLIPIT